ncbi:MAG: hypothetical protein E4H16_01270 [Candidatus Atribacteria bacterium]|nr:MAG: hypothetical protein E4H16_01270 [Candidatus Atribacteria bacterium]
MKKIYLTLLILAFGFHVAYTQINQEKLELFRTNIFPQYNVYFTEAALTPGGQLILSADTRWLSLSREGKTTVMDKITRSWQESLILVQFGKKRELWGLNGTSGKAVQIDVWDPEKKAVLKTPVASPSTVSQHPWFVYFGLQEQFDSNKNLNIGFSSRVGFFLLRDRWDLAFTGSGFMSGNIEADSPTYQTSLGLMSKVYFPIVKYRISPNIGAELSWNQYTISDTKNSSLSPFLITGINWYVGSGSLDLSVRTGKQYVVMIGYTFMPGFKPAR